MQGLLVLIRRHLLAGWRYRWIALATSWLVCVAGWIGVGLIPNQYEAHTRLYVDADAILTPLLRGLAVDSAPLNDVEVLRRTLLSRPNLDTLIGRTGLGATLTSQADRERLLQLLGNQIKVIPETGNLFTITYRNQDRTLAYDVVKSLSAIFIESANFNSRADMQNAQRFLDQQIAVYEGQLRDAEQRRADFKARYVDVFSADGGSRLESARSGLRALEGSLQDAKVRRDMLAQSLRATPPTLVTDTDAAAPDQQGQTARTRIADAERRLQELRLRYTEQHPDVIAARNLVQALRANPFAATDPSASASLRSHSVPNPVYQELKVRLVDAETSVLSLQRQVDEATRERARLEGVARTDPMLEAEYQNMDRDYTVLRRNYEELLARRESTRIAAAANTNADKIKLQVVDPAEVPGIPVAPRRLLLMSGVLLAGLGAGIAIALAIVRLDGSFYTIDDLRKLGLPVLGGIALIEPANPGGSVLRTVPFFAGLLLLVATFGGLLSAFWL